MVYEILKVLPNFILRGLSKIIPNFSELINSICLDRFIDITDFENLNVEHCPVCIIEEGEWEYPLFNICFVENMLKNIVYLLYNGYYPVVGFVQHNEKINLWEQFLEQPLGIVNEIGGGNV